MAKDPAPLLQGTLELIVLQLLRVEPTNGYDLSLRIQAVSADVLQVNAGSLYPALYRLVARGWVSSEWRPSENNRAARFYTLTRAGRKQLATERVQWEKLSLGVNLILSGAKP